MSASSIALTPEAGARRYFRPQPSNGWLDVHSPDPAPVATTQWLSELGIPVPAIEPGDSGQYRVEDCGDRHLCHDPDPAHYDALCRKWRLLLDAALPPEHPNAQLALDQDLFARELKQTQNEWWNFQAGQKITQFEQQAGTLAAAASAGPQTIQHRDFHARNLLLPEGKPIIWIDHQDLRIGPLFYDLASLWTDAYVDLPDASRKRLREELDGLAHWAGLTADEAQTQFLLTALQRVLKALGTFGKLIREGRADYQEPEQRAHDHAIVLTNLDSLSRWDLAIDEAWHPAWNQWQAWLRR